MGRPREFCLEGALEKALEVFWRRGFAGASLSELTAAMGITRPSLYSSYGNKEALFRKALDLYDARYMGFLSDALARSTPRDVAAAVLVGMAGATEKIRNNVFTDDNHVVGKSTFRDGLEASEKICYDVTCR